MAEDWTDDLLAKWGLDTEVYRVTARVSVSPPRLANAPVREANRSRSSSGKSLLRHAFSME